MSDMNTKLQEALSNLKTLPSERQAAVVDVFYDLTAPEDFELTAEMQSAIDRGRADIAAGNVVTGTELKAMLNEFRR